MSDEPQYTYKVQEVWQQHQEIIRLIVLGHDDEVIAEKIGYTLQTINSIRNSPIVRERIKQLMRE